METCLEKGLEIFDTLLDYSNGPPYPVVLPSAPMDAKEGLGILNKYGLEFDIIDTRSLRISPRFCSRCHLIVGQ
jgi:hypothetical protein